MERVYAVNGLDYYGDSLEEQLGFDVKKRQTIDITNLNQGAGYARLR